ncbi:IS66 family transposase [Acidiferrimicrobium sp. IK]|uniref:IS66 family transposase n=1 Tax=Acidiferrimicrobium sp. IK TaxID=2871700 RepID=UPI0021CB1F4F|nr:IS66 family transposase [Acidiferrimicrobium sp. IK]MCU4187266.1 IS66 family transposase [Acidiferrimicrobium sp. IK]
MEDADRLARLETALARLQREMAVKDQVILAQLDRIAELERALEDTRRGGKRQAAPFAKGAPEANPKRPGRKRGDAHGRHGHRLAPDRDPDRILQAGLPVGCPDCGGHVSSERTEQQWSVEIPPIAPVVTRIDVEIGTCDGCGRRVQGHHPEQSSDALGAAASTVGPIAKAWAMWLHYSLGLSFGKTRAVLAKLGIDMTAGAICAASASAASKQLAPVHAELVTAANASAALTMDETGWHVGGHGAWLWVATNPNLSCYWVTPHRGFADATETITADFDGVLIRDGYAVYNSYDQATHQTCLAHLMRRCREMEADLDGPDRKIPVAARKLLADALAARDLDPAGKAAAVVELNARLDTLCARPVGHEANRRLLAHLDRQSSAMFTFLTAEPALEVDATNWRAETGIRPAVVNRKVWGGNRTWRGATTQGRITSIIRTANQHGIDAVNYIADRARGPDPGLTTLLA